MTLNLDPVEYAKSVSRELNENLITEMIKIIQPNVQYMSFDVIVDIGSGPGTLTQMLANYFKHKRIIGLDFDNEMVLYSQKTNNFSTVEYKTQDMSQTWDLLDPQLKQLESKVSLIHSTDAFHWIRPKDQLVANCHKLLAKNGLIFTQFACFPDMSQGLSEDLLSKTNIKSLSADKQIDKWIELFKQNGFEKIMVNYSVEDVYFTRQDIKIYHELIWKYFQLDFKCIENNDQDQISDKFENYLFDAHMNPGSKQLDSKAWIEFMTNDSMTKTDFECKYYLPYLKMLFKKI